MNLTNKEYLCQFQSYIQGMFPQGFCTVSEQKLGEVYYVIRFANTLTPTNGIIQNSKTFLTGIVNIDRNGQFTMEKPCFSYQMRDAGIKWRVIKAATAEQFVAKLLQWFEKNTPALNKLEGYC